MPIPNSDCPSDLHIIGRATKDVGSKTDLEGEKKKFCLLGITSSEVESTTIYHLPGAFTRDF